MRKLILGVALGMFLCGGVKADEPPVISQIPFYQDGQAGELFTYDVDATGDPAPTFVLTESPSGMTIDAATGLIEWTPADNQQGVTMVRLEAVNSAGSYLGYFTVRVAGDTFQPPAIAPIPDQTVTAGQAWSYDADVTGYPRPRFSLENAPGIMSVDLFTGYMTWNAGLRDVGTYTITVWASSSMGEDSKTFSLEVVPAVYTVTISSGEGGSVTTPGEGPFEYQYASRVSIEATPDEGYVFLCWSGAATASNGVWSPEEAITTMFVGKDCSLVANFERTSGPRHTLTLSAGEGGQIKTPGEGVFDYAAGTTVPVTADNDGGYHWRRWTGSAVDAGKVGDPSNETTTVTMDGDYTLQANFVRLFALEVTASFGGRVVQPGQGSFLREDGASVGLVAQPNSGYHFTGWTGSAVSAGKVADPLSISTSVIVDADWRVVANFDWGDSPEQRTLTISSGPGGSVSTPGEGSFIYDEEMIVPIRATAEQGYEFTNWTGTAVDAGRVANRGSMSTTVTMHRDYTLQANFRPVSGVERTLTISSGAGGAVLVPGEGSFTYAEGTSISVSVQVEDGYAFAGWTGSAVDAGSVADPGSASTTVTINGNYALRASFRADSATQWTLVTSSSSGGSILTPGEGAFIYDEDTNVWIQAQADEDHEFTGWTGSAVDADRVGNPSSIRTTVTMDDNYTLRANFRAGSSLQRTLTVSCGRGGTVLSPGIGMFLYESGEQVSLEAKADPAYRFSHWSGSIASTASTTLISMDSDHQARANFVNVLDVIHVDDDAIGDPGPCDAGVSNPTEDGSVEYPFDSIQEAIEMAEDFATIYVHPGTYFENIDLLGKSLYLTSRDVDAQGIESYPVVDGGNLNPTVTFASGEDANCVLEGFVITRGQGSLAGGICCRDSDPVLINCLIVGNRASHPDGAGVYCENSSAVLINCTVSGNYGGQQGAGLRFVRSHAVLANSIVQENFPYQLLANPSAWLTVVYSDVAKGWSGVGNIDADALFALPGYWADVTDPSVAVEPDSCDVIWVDGDYHLISGAGRWDPNTLGWVLDANTSPCIDAGDPLSDLGEEPEPHGNVVNMGAYGGTTQASKSTGLQK